jgi:hypothetical protein
MSCQVIEFSAARRARGLPPRSPVIAALQPAPGKRRGNRVYMPSHGLFGVVTQWRPDYRHGACFLTVSSCGIDYRCHESNVEPAPDQPGIA